MAVEVLEARAIVRKAGVSPKDEVKDTVKREAVVVDA